MFEPMATPVIIVPNEPDPLHPQKQQHCIVLDYQPLSKSISTEHSGNRVISYYPLPNITDLLVRLQKYTIFSSLDLRLGYHYISLTLDAKMKTTFATTDGKWHWNIALFGICSLPGVFCYLMS